MRPAICAFFAGLRICRRVLTFAKLCILLILVRPVQIVESTGTVMIPYMDFPQLLSLLLRILHGGSPQQRKEVMKVRPLHTFHLLNELNCSFGGTAFFFISSVLSLFNENEAFPRVIKALLPEVSVS